MTFWEIFVILLVAFIVIKPERLPEITYTLGRWAAKWQKFYQNFIKQFQSLP